MSRAVRAPVSGSRSGTVVPEPGNAGRSVNSAPRSRARPMTARRAAADALHRSRGSLADWGIVVSSFEGAGSRPGLGLVLHLPGGFGVAAQRETDRFAVAVLGSVGDQLGGQQLGAAARVVHAPARHRPPD